MAVGHPCSLVRLEGTSSGMVVRCWQSVVRRVGVGAPAHVQVGSPTTDNRQQTIFANVSVGSPTTDNRQRTTDRNVSEGSDVLLPLDRAAAVLGLGHHPIDRSERQHDGEHHGRKPTDRDQQPIKRRLANVAESEEKIAHLDGRLSGCEYKGTAGRWSVGVEATLLSVVGLPANADDVFFFRSQLRQPDNRQPRTDNPCW